MVPRAGLEPARPDGHQILSLTCLPIPYTDGYKKVGTIEMGNEIINRI